MSTSPVSPAATLGLMGWSSKMMLAPNQNKTKNKDEALFETKGERVEWAT